MSKGKATSRRARRPSDSAARYWFAMFTKEDGSGDADFYDLDEKIETVKYDSVDQMYLSFGAFVERRNAETPSAALH